MRLNYYKIQQSHIKSELYEKIVDNVRAWEIRGNKVSIGSVLPTSFIRGYRDMCKIYLDAMALVQRYSKSDLFITMICNPEWEEINQELLSTYLTWLQEYLEQNCMT